MSRANMIVLADYEGKVIPFRDDGWFNMTKAAKHFGKRVDNFFANDETVKYIAALQKLPGMSGSLVATTVGRSGGTWAHPKLAVAFARWCDVEFSVWCDMQIEKILHGRTDEVMRMMASNWERRISLEQMDARSFAMASWGGRAMCDRKKWLPRIRREREALRLEMEPTLFALGV